jgi:hypothetical protein
VHSTFNDIPSHSALVIITTLIIRTLNNARITSRRRAAEARDQVQIAKEKNCYESQAEHKETTQFASKYSKHCPMNYHRISYDIVITEVDLL